MIKKVCIVLTIICGLAIQVELVLAQEKVPNAITVSPAFLDVQVPGEQAQVSEIITITNTTDQAITLEVLPTSVDQQNLYGGISFEAFSGAANDSFPFLSFSNDRVVIDPQQSQQITVTIENRSSLKPGGTYIAVIFRAALDEVPTEQVILPAVSSLLLINKQGGEVYNLSLTEVAGLPSFISFSLPTELGLTFNNQGNTHLQPRGTISLNGSFRRLLAQSTVNESSLYILPGRERLIPQTIKSSQRLLPFDFVSVEITGSSGNERTPYYFESSFVYIAPWFLISCLIFCLIISIVIYKRNENNH
ncbi:MAG: hypothetical protein QG639_94 [Patescibacteria group bacterium]|jgi:hypothetical protein|nr:hypothetical protein [Patescibacteria group bacterium]